ncbi:Holliday junction resolvase RuvX [Rarobacter faecitabidus]|uniref:Holliday junction resolvase RuvX n=1 Tax=Rarobacter faecitabidus TaxID=13243 RepID=UPI001FE7AADA|nr:Holliday junction resolvase RuvX [Rarobacter faecitabidus]
MGVDVGQVRIGLASSDPDGLIATPVETVLRDQSVTFSELSGRISPGGMIASWPADIRRIGDEVAQRGAEVVYVGLPRHLSGAEGQASVAARDYAYVLAVHIAPVPVRLVDERMTTVSAHRALSAAGRSRRKHMSVVDQVAAVEILQGALDFERSTLRRAGELVDTTTAVGDES